MGVPAVSLRLGLKELISSVDGQISSKRVVTVVAFVLLCVAFITNLFFHLQISDFIFKDFTLIVLAGLGVVGAEPALTSLMNLRRKDKDAGQ